MYYKKSLGQHFLRDPRILEKIVAAAKLTPEDTVLEVGPGEGTLTALLLQKAGRVIAVEKDGRLIPVLQQRFAMDIAAGKLEVIHADILRPTTDNLPPTTPYKIVANIPYYITGQFLRKFLQTERQPSSMTLLLQKEVAKRIVGRADPTSPRLRRAQKESLLSLGVKAYGTPRYIATVKAGSFVPPPKVDSAIISISNISKEFFSNLREEEFFALLKKGFAHPRKLLASNLGVSAETLQTCGIAARARAENLSLAQWRCLFSAIARLSR